MSTAPRFGCDILNALHGAQPMYLHTPMTGHSDNQAEGHLLEIVSAGYVRSCDHGIDDQGAPLPLPVVSPLRYDALWAETSAKEDVTRRIANCQKIDTGQRKVRILWFHDGSGILLEELDKNYACLPVSLFLSNKGLANSDLACDVEIWCQAMRRMPQMLVHLDQDSFDNIKPHQSVAPWGIFHPKSQGDDTCNQIYSISLYAMARQAYEFGPGRYTFSIGPRRIMRDGSIGPAEVTVSLRHGSSIASVTAWCPEDLQDIPDHPNITVPAWKMINQEPDVRYGFGHCTPAIPRYQIQTSFHEQPSAHEVLEARAFAKSWFTTKAQHELCNDPA